MKNPKLLAAAILSALALALAGASSLSHPSPVEVGKTYQISNSQSVFEGRIVSDLGGGWYRLQVKGGEMSINAAQAFWIKEK